MAGRVFFNCTQIMVFPKAQSTVTINAGDDTIFDLWFRSEEGMKPLN